MQSLFFFFFLVLTIRNKFNSCFSKKKKEISLILVLDLGLLAMTTNEDKAHELLEESLCPLSEALKSGSETSKISHV